MIKPETLPPELNPAQHKSLSEVISYIAATHGELPGFTCFGKTLTYGEVDALSNRLANYLINTAKLKKGDRIAIQLPNVLQFPIAVYAALKAGLVVVNTNPLYTAHEMEHQFKDSGAVAVVILESFCDKLEKILPATTIETIIIAQPGDLQPGLKSIALNFAAKYVKKMTPSYQLPDSQFFSAVLKSESEDFEVDEERLGSGDDVAVILYTGGTTGVAKGAMLTHANLIANMMQLRQRCLMIMRDRLETLLAPLPLYHSYAFLLHCWAMPYAGNHSLLIPNPRDLKGLFGLLKKHVVNGFVGINTLYLALLRHKDFDSVDFSELKFCGAGGMAMTTSVAKEWHQRTGCEIFEGYGLTECSPVATVNLPGKVMLGTVGYAVPETDLKVVSESGETLSWGEKGELWIKGPQVMAGYWQRPKETSETITEDGWLKTGDYAEIAESGIVKIVDRKKDMILVSGFNVFPNEIEDWVNSHPKVLETAAIGVSDDKTGEAVKLFVVTSDPSVTKDELIAYSREGLTAYKVPRQIEFKEDLPKSIIGKIIRRELRED